MATEVRVPTTGNAGEDAVLLDWLVVEGQEVDVRGGHGGVDVVDGDPHGVAAFLGAIGAGVVDQDAAHGLRGLNPARAEALAAGALEDPVRLARLIGAGGASDALRAGLTKTAWLGSVLPILVGRGDVAGLAAALGDRSLPEAARLGAIEALGRLDDPAVEAPLRAVATSTAEDEELRKAAWRALRRARRQRSRAQETHA